MTASTNPMPGIMFYVIAGLIGVLAYTVLPREYAGVGGFLAGVLALALVIHPIIRDMDTEPEAAS